MKTHTSTKEHENTYIPQKGHGNACMPQRDGMKTHTYIPQRDTINITLQRVAHAVISIYA